MLSVVWPIRMRMDGEIIREIIYKNSVIGFILNLNTNKLRPLLVIAGSSDSAQEGGGSFQEFPQVTYNNRWIFIFI